MISCFKIVIGGEKNMKVEIISDINPDEHKYRGSEVNTLEFNGNTIFPYYINVMSIEHYSDKMIFRMKGKYKTRIIADYDRENNKSDDKLWILGADVELSSDFFDKQDKPFKEKIM